MASDPTLARTRLDEVERGLDAIEATLARLDADEAGPEAAEVAAGADADANRPADAAADSGDPDLDHTVPDEESGAPTTW